MAEQKDPLAELRRLAEAATPGPFDIERREEDCGYFCYILHNAHGDVAWCNDDLDPNARRHALFLQRFDPATVLKLLDVVEAAKEMRRHVNGSELGFLACDEFDAALAALEGDEGPAVRDAARRASK